MVVKIAARDLDVEECEALIRRGVPRNCRGVLTMTPEQMMPSFGKNDRVEARGLNIEEADVVGWDVTTGIQRRKPR